VSRIGRLPVAIPKGVEVHVKGSYVRVKGPRGMMEHTFPTDMQIALEGDSLKVQRPTDEREHRALHGMTRAIINNMVIGVSNGFEKVLEVNGVGYRAELDGKNLVLYVGYSPNLVRSRSRGMTSRQSVRSPRISARYARPSLIMKRA
jgi:large subunit ribosomal protein L6